MQNKIGQLSYTELCELVERGVVEGVGIDAINSNSINVTLGNKFLLERPSVNGVGGIHYRPLEFSKRESPAFLEVEGGVILAPGAFCLAALVEKINLPSNLTCSVMLRSSAARMGIEHSYAGFGDSGYSGNLTLELKNFLQYHSIHLRGGDKICQLVFHHCTPVPDGKCYARTGAKYCGDTGPQPIKQEVK